MKRDSKKDDRWKEQLERTRRWYKRIEKIDRNNPITTDELDFLYAFFLNCYHMKDWLDHSGVLSGEKLKELFENLYMKYCHDICIGTKHSKIKNPKIHSDWQVAREYISGNPPSIEISPMIRLGQNLQNMCDLARNCMDLLEKFLHENKLT